MRGRKPRGVLLTADDRAVLEQLARRRSVAWSQVQRARIVLAIADGDRVQEVARRMQCHPATVWRTCRRYEQAGVEAMLEDQARCGNPGKISPPATSAAYRFGVLGTGCQGAAHHALE